MKIDIGMNDKQRKDISERLGNLLADTYALYLKTHNFHWNVTGPYFESLHKMFEEQYNEIWLAVDVIAERIRAVGFPVPPFSKLDHATSVKEEMKVPSWEKMVAQLVSGHEAVIRTARGIVPMADKAGDEVTLNLLADRMEIHEKTAWMLRSLIS